MRIVQTKRYFNDNILVVRIKLVNICISEVRVYMIEIGETRSREFIFSMRLVSSKKHVEV
jgi:hypothetical protein